MLNWNKKIPRGYRVLKALAVLTSMALGYTLAFFFFPRGL